jgi:hypothetical protein
MYTVARQTCTFHDSFQSPFADRSDAGDAPLAGFAAGEYRIEIASKSPAATTAEHAERAEILGTGTSASSCGEANELLEKIGTQIGAGDDWE